MVLIPAAVALFVAWSLLIPAAQLDRTSRFRALGRSRRLVRHQVLTVTALVLFTAVLGNLGGRVLATAVTLAVQAPLPTRRPRRRGGRVTGSARRGSRAR